MAPAPLRHHNAFIGRVNRKARGVLQENAAANIIHHNFALLRTPFTVGPARVLNGMKVGCCPEQRRRLGCLPCRCGVSTTSSF